MAQSSYSFEEHSKPCAEPTHASTFPGQDINSPLTNTSPTRTIVTALGSPNTIATTSGTTTTKVPGKAASKEASKSPKFWSEEEDKKLLHAIAVSANPLEWTKIAEQVQQRTAKQCRERYLNHLNPNIRLGDWSPLEDTTIFMLKQSEGKSWRRFTKIPVLEGRSDNSIKNRYNHLERRFNRVMKNVETTAPMEALAEKIKSIRPFQIADELGSARTDPTMVKYLTKRILDPDNKAIEVLEGEFKFGPFHQVGKNEVCGRCSLITPSVQTGNSICKETGWCQACCKTSVLVLGDVLRVSHVEASTKPSP